MSLLKADLIINSSVSLLRFYSGRLLQCLLHKISTTSPHILTIIFRLATITRSSNHYICILQNKSIQPSSLHGHRINTCMTRLTPMNSLENQGIAQPQALGWAGHEQSARGAVSARAAAAFAWTVSPARTRETTERRLRSCI